jgi:hypothetical protein
MNKAAIKIFVLPSEVIIPIIIMIIEMIRIFELKMFFGTKSNKGKTIRRYDEKTV